MCSQELGFYPKTDTIRGFRQRYRRLADFSRVEPRRTPICEHSAAERRQVCLDARQLKPRQDRIPHHFRSKNKPVHDQSSRFSRYSHSDPGIFRRRPAVGSERGQRVVAAERVCRRMASVGAESSHQPAPCSSGGIDRTADRSAYYSGTTVQRRLAGTRLEGEAFRHVVRGI